MKNLAFALLILALPLQAQAAEEFILTIQNHRFEPETLKIPTGQKVKIMVVNKDATPEEFESYELNREKIIKGNSSGVVFVGPLDPGTYPFFGEFNMGTAKGQIVAGE
jgi:hypothetical protein